MAAFAFLANERRKRENHNSLSLKLLAQSEAKAVKKQFDEWERDF